jgi:threonine dehydratase
MLSVSHYEGVSFASGEALGYQPEFENVTSEIISINEIWRAATRIAPYIKRTPTLIDTYLCERLGTNVYLKHELLQRTGAFKVRGAFNKMLQLTDDERERGVVAVSAGNHAQAVAYAARILELKAIILMPENTPDNYVQKTLKHGAEVRFYPTLARAFDAASSFEDEGYVYIHPFDDRDVIAGQGTIGLEILEDVPDVTDVVVSIGGGGLSGGVACAIRSLRPNVNVWGVETRGAHSMSAALDAGELVELSEITSIARTLGAARVGALNFELAKEYLSGVTVVDDSEAVAEMFCLLDKAKVLTEPATSCTLAAAERLRDKFGPDSHVVLILCGGNIGLDDLFSYRKNVTQ